MRSVPNTTLIDVGPERRAQIYAGAILRRVHTIKRHVHDVGPGVGS